MEPEHPPRPPFRLQPDSESSTPSNLPRTVHPVQYKLAGLLTLATIGSCLAWFLSETGLSSTGLYFIAVPGAMAVVASLIPARPDDVHSGITRGTIIAVLASALIVREGFICVVMALPLIIPVVVIIAWAVQKSKEGGNGHAALILPLVLFGSSGEGVAFEIPAVVTVNETRTLDATAKELDESFNEVGELPNIEPLLFQLPFPRPTMISGSGSDVGDVRLVEFGKAGTLKLEVVERSADSITWKIVENGTPMANWMTIRSISASWLEKPEGLELRVTIDFERELAPAFYFDPLERWGASELAEVVIDMAEHNVAKHDVIKPNVASNGATNQNDG